MDGSRSGCWGWRQGSRRSSEGLQHAGSHTQAFSVEVRRKAIVRFDYFQTEFAKPYVKPENCSSQIIGLPTAQSDFEQDVDRQRLINGPECISVAEVTY